MSLLRKSFTRNTPPDQSSLVSALAPLLAPANAGGFHVSYDGTHVHVDYGDWTGVDLTAVQTAVTNCAASSTALDVDAEVDNLSPFMKAVLLTILDRTNAIATKAGMATVTPAQWIAAIKAKARTLVS